MGDQSPQSRKKKLEAFPDPRKQARIKLIKQIRESDNADFINELPNEALVNIFRRLPILAKGRICVVCKRWYSLYQNYSSIRPNFIYLDDYYGSLIKNSVKQNKKLKDYIGLDFHPQISIADREALVDWLFEVCEEHSGDSQVITLGVGLLDRFLSISRAVPKSLLQLLGIVSYWEAAKYLGEYPPIKELAETCANVYDPKDFNAMEIKVLNDLKFEVHIRTSKNFTDYLLSLSFSGEIRDVTVQETLTKATEYLLEASLMSYEISILKPSAVAAAAVCLARASLGYAPWPQFLEAESYYKLEENIVMCKKILDCLNDLSETHLVQMKYTRKENLEMTRFKFKKFWD